MEKTATEDVRSHLMETNEDFRRLAEEHSLYDRRIEELSNRPYPTQEEQMEEARLKRLKLSLKDRMEDLMRAHQERA